MSSAMLPMAFENEPRSTKLYDRLKARSNNRYIVVGSISVLCILFYFTFLGPPPPPPLPPSPHHPNPSSSEPPHPDRDPLWTDRANQVKAAFQHAYSSYERLAFPHDELLPLSNGGDDRYNGWGVSVVDALDTMLLMGLEDEFNRALVHTARINLNEDKYVHFFETVIRYLGGLISAYQMTNNSILLSRADDLGHRLLHAFDGPSGMPAYRVNMVTGEQEDPPWLRGGVHFSEIGSCQVEFRALSHLTGKPEYIKVVDRITDHLRGLNIPDGLYPLRYRKSDGSPIGTEVSVGARADSSYEYFLKQYLLTNKTEPKFRDMYVQSANGIIDKLLYLSPQRKLLYVTDSDLKRVSGTFEHLSCFFGGLLALGVANIPDLPPTHAWAAEGLTHTCWMTYADQPSGLGPDEIGFLKPSNQDLWVKHIAAWRAEGSPGGKPPGVDQASPVAPGQPLEYFLKERSYHLRPETVESFYVLWKTTGDVKWRERGWQMFESIEKNAKMPNGYSSVSDVAEMPTPKKDEMPSWYLAETLKYFYLLFANEDMVPLDKYVLNTEAHPIRIFEWSPWEKEDFGITS